MKNSINNGPKRDFNELDLRKWSRWSDKKGRLFSIVSIYYGIDHSKPFSETRFDRVAYDLLNVHDESIEHIELGRFVKYVIDGHLKPWKQSEQASLAKKKEN